MAITKSEKDWERLRAALQQDDATTVREIAGHLDLKSRKYYKACMAAARAGAGNSLEALLEAGGGFRFRNFWHDAENREYARAMIAEALASQNPEPVLSVIYAANKKEEGSNKIAELVFLNKDVPIDVIHDYLEEKPGYFESFVSAAGLNPTEDSTKKLRAILTYTAAAAPRSRSILDDALITVAEAGDVEKTKLLLMEQQANPCAKTAKSLMNACTGKLEEHKEIVDLLLPHITPELCRDVLTRLRERPEKIDDDIIAAVEAAAQRVATEQPPAAAPEQGPLKDRFNRLSADVLEEILPPDGALKETARYYFATRQQVFMTDGKVTHAVSFDNLPDGVEAAMQARLDARANPVSLRLRKAPST